MVESAGLSLLYDGLGVLDTSCRDQMSPDFFRGMASRMVVSRHKYGRLQDAYPHKVNAVESLLVRLARYLGAERFEQAVANVSRQLPAIEDAKHRRDHGNLEYLMDVGNFAMIEFMCPSLPEAHFIAEDSSASPGRVHTTGALTQSANTHEVENTRLGGVRGATAGGHYKREGD